jgi:DNA repair protein RadC
MIKLTTMNQPHFSIKCWSEDDRPREKLRLKGRNALSDAELLAIILGSGTRTKSAVDLAQEVLASSNNDLSQLSKLSIENLKQFSGIGDAKAIAVAAAMELGRRRREMKHSEIQKITGSKDVYHYMRPFMEDLMHEEFYVIGLKRSNEVIGHRIISKGGMTSTIADGKIIFSELLAMKAVACILCHNHPSGAKKPSDADVKLTRKLGQFAGLIEIQIIDHVIITDTGYFSFADEGLSW